MNLTQEVWWKEAQENPNAVILDVRTFDEFSRGFIPGALNIDIYKGQGFVYEVDALDKTKDYYVYCMAGGRSAQACNIMQQLDFVNTYNLVGGISEWEGPVVQE